MQLFHEVRERQPSLEAGFGLGRGVPVRSARQFQAKASRARAVPRLGAGIGDSEAAFAAFGVPFGERRARFEEALDFIARAWTSDAFSYGGRFTRFPRKTPESAEKPFTHEPYEKPFKLQWQRAGLEPKYLAVTPRPVQIPHPPIWVEAGDGADVALAARLGYAILPAPTASDAEVIALYRTYGERMAGSGRSLTEVERPVIREVFCAETRDEAIAIAGEPLQAVYARHAEAGALGNAEASLDRLMQERFVLGDPDQVFERFKTLQQEAGINHVICRFRVPGIEHEAVVRSLRLYAGEVITRLRS